MEVEKSNEKTSSLLTNLRKRLEDQLSDSAKKNKLEVKKLVAEELVEIEKKIKHFYYWLFGAFFILLAIIIGIFFYLRR